LVVLFSLTVRDTLGNVQGNGTISTNDDTDASEISRPVVIQSMIHPTILSDIRVDT